MNHYHFKCTVCQEQEALEGIPPEIRESGICEIKASSPFFIYNPTLCPFAESQADWQEIRLEQEIS